MSSARDQIEESARRALSEAKEHPAAAAVAAGAAAATAGVALRLRDGDPSAADSGAYRLLAGEPVDAAMKRVLTAQVDDAIAHLRGETEVEPAEAVHEARKDIKKVRSALRMIRHELGDDEWRRENDDYREIARSMSGFRDAEILVEALDDLGERFGFGSSERFPALREQLAGEIEATRRDGSMERAMANAAVALQRARGRVEGLPLDGDGWDLIGPGIHRSYRRGRKRLRAVEEDTTVTTLHELRKRVKDLWYQLRLIRDADRTLVGSLADHAHDLSDHLGDDHDLALLREEAVRREGALAEPSDQRQLLALIDRRRGELQFAAISLGERIYDRKPKRFVKRLRDRWETWREREPVEA
jgi:CHAD domain-containing protein